MKFLAGTEVIAAPERAGALVFVVVARLQMQPATVSGEDGAGVGLAARHDVSVGRQGVGPGRLIGSARGRWCGSGRWRALRPDAGGRQQRTIPGLRDGSCSSSAQTDGQANHQPTNNDHGESPSPGSMSGITAIGVAGKEQHRDRDRVGNVQGEADPGMTKKGRMMGKVDRKTSEKTPMAPRQSCWLSRGYGAGSGILRRLIRRASSAEEGKTEATTGGNSSMMILSACRGS